ncbi:unnamed protein product [Rhodiola kirilowii]
MSSNSPCAACKFQRRKCTPECIFAPYFPPENPQKFINVHKVFGGSNVSKILSDINPAQREDAAKSLAYEAEARLRDPIYGCVGFISYLQQKLKQIHVDLENAKKELATYIGPSAMQPTYPQHAYGQMVYQQQMMGHPSAALPYTNLIGAPLAYSDGSSQQLVICDQQQPQMMGGGNPSSSASALPYTSLMPSMIGAGASAQPVLICEQQQQHGVDPQQYGAVATTGQHELIRNYALQQQQQQDYLVYKSSDQYETGGGQIVGPGFIQMAADETGGGPSLALGVNYDNPYSTHIQQQQQQQHDNVHHALQAQLVLQSQQHHPEQVLQTQLHQQTHHKADSDEGRSTADPSC